MDLPPQGKGAAKRSTNLVQTERVDQLLSVLSHSPQGLSLGELATAVKLPKASLSDYPPRFFRSPNL